MRKMKKVISLALVGAMVFSMTACGTKDKPAESKAPEGSSAPAATTEAKKNPVTLKVVTEMGGTDPNTTIYQQVIKDFEQQNDYITISDDSAVADQDWKNKVAADFSVGNEPDVIQFFTDSNASELLKTGKFMTIEEIRKEYPDYAKNISEAAMKSASAPDGTSYAVPTTGYWEALFCNKKLFDDNGLELPTDWDKLEKAIKTFKEKKITPIGVSLNEMPHYWMEHLLLSSAGPEEFVQIPKTVPDSWVKGIDMFKKLRDMGAFPKDTDSIKNEMIYSNFDQGKCAMFLDGSWRVGGTKDQENTVVVAFPDIPGGKGKGDGVAISGFSSGFYITKKAWDDPDKRDAAVKFIMANTSDEAITKYWNGNGAHASATDLKVSGDISKLKQSGIDFAKTITNPVSPTDSRITQEAMTAFVNAIPDVSTGAKSAKDAVDVAVKTQNK